MSQSRFFRYLIGAFLSIFIWQLPLMAAARWYKLYKDGKISELIRLQQGGQIMDPQWNQFVQALMIANGDSAMARYKSIYAKTEDNDLKKSIRERLSQYFYARGYYETAEKIRKNKFRTEKSSPPNRSSHRFGIQTGAYSTLRNARLARNKILNKVQNVSIIEKNRNGRKLFIVVVGNFANRKDAEKSLRSLKSRIQGFIIEF